MACVMSLSVVRPLSETSVAAESAPALLSDPKKFDEVSESLPATGMNMEHKKQGLERPTLTSFCIRDPDASLNLITDITAPTELICIELN